MTTTPTLPVVVSRPEKSLLKLIIILAGLLLLSCSHQFPAEPQKGDVRVVDGVEYVYGKNPRYMVTPMEPLYVWLRIDQYSPDTLDDFTFRSPVPTKEEKELEARLAKLEAEYNKRMGIQPKTAPQPQTASPRQVAPPSRPVSAPPAGTASMASLPKPTSVYPSPKMKRRVLVLPTTGAADPSSGRLAERVTNRLMAKLESTGMIISVDPRAIGFRGDVAQPGTMKELDELYGIQAIVQGALFETPVTSDIKVSFTIYNAETGLILRQLGSDVALLTRQQYANSDAEQMKAIDAGIEPIAEDVLRSILSLDWHARIASTEQGKIFINAGRLSGLEKGDTLEVYAPGEQIIDAATKMPLGKLKGDYRGEIEVADFIGADAAWAKPKSGGKFSPTDLVYLKR